MNWPSNLLLALLPGIALGAGGCDPKGDGPPDAPDPNGPQFEFGHLRQEHFPDGVAIDDLPFDPLEEGEPVEMIFGGQGTVMLPLPIRGRNFGIPVDGDLTAWPELNIHVDVEDHNDGIGGHFFRVANYPVYFTPVEGMAWADEEWEFFYFTVIVPDEYELAELEGLPAHLHATLEPVDEEEIVLDLDFEIGKPPP